MSAEDHKSFLLPVTARIMAATEQDAQAVALAIYDGSSAIKHTAQANGADCSVLLLNYNEDQLELVGRGYGEAALSEARRALIDGAGVEYPNHVLIAKAALMIESAREGATDGADWEDSVIETVDGHEFTDALALAEDTPELFRWSPERMPGDDNSPLTAVQNTVEAVMRAAVHHVLSDDNDKRTEREGFLREAKELGEDAARSAASWTTDDRTTDDGARRLLAQMRDGDPAADDYLPRRPDLSGEFADEVTPTSLFEEVVGRPPELDALDAESRDGGLLDQLASAWEDGVSEAFGLACEAELMRFIGEEPSK